MINSSNDRKQNILLITSGFPYGESERSFMSVEFAEMQKKFNVSILAVTAMTEIKYPLPAVKRIEHVVMPLAHGASKRELIKIARLPIVKAELKKASYHCRPSVIMQRTVQIVGAWFKCQQLEPLIRRIVDEDKIDLIYTYWCKPFTLAALRVKETSGNLRVVTRFHNVDLFNERIPGGWNPFRGYISQHCDGLIFVAEEGKDYYTNTWKDTDKAKCRVAYLGCSAAHGIIPPKDIKELVIVSCANAIPLKRIDMIIDALSLLPDTMKVSWYHFGDGSELAGLKQRAIDKLGGKTNIDYKFMGFVSNAELRETYYKICPQLFVTTTSIEGLPISVVEASSMGIVAIGTDVGGIREIIKDGQTGYLLSSNPCIEQVSEAIIKYSELPFAQKQAMSQAAYTLWQEKFDAQRNAVTFVSYLFDLSGNRTEI